MKLTFDETKGRVSVRLEDQDLAHVAVEELKKERSRREKLEAQLALIMDKLGIKEE